MGYPGPEAERELIRQGLLDSAADVIPAAALADVVSAQDAADRVRVDETIVSWIQRLAAATRERKGVALGVSPRGAVHLLRAARAAAIIEGRDYLVPDDVKALAISSLAHHCRSARFQD